MSVFGVSQGKYQALLARLLALGIKDSDLTESFVRSSGKGGQNVNKTNTCVDLTHIPSQTRIKCQRTRELPLNRYYARVELCERLEGQLSENVQQQKLELFKIRKQKRKRSKKANAKRLEAKRLNAAKKVGRRGTED
jgi:protein subunit release factor B